MCLPSGFTWRALKPSVTSPTPEADTPDQPGPPVRWDCKEEPRSKRTLRNLWNENEEEGTEGKGLFHTTVGASERTGELSKEKSKHLFYIIL